MSDFQTNDGIQVGLPGSGVDGHRVFVVGDDTHNGCPVLSKTRVVTMPRGIQGIIRWQIRDKDGNPINLADIINNAPSGGTTPPPAGQVIFRFVDALCCGAESAVVHQIIGEGYDVEEGLVQVEITSALADSPGIWRFEIAITDVDGVPQRMDRGLLSIEYGLFPTVIADKRIGPPTLNEIRIHIRDSQVENDLLDEIEFDDAEIIACIIRPIQEWNETPPDVGCFTARTFPFRHFWLDAITARLLRIAAHWYRRNKFNSSQGGLTVADRDKENPYLTAAVELENTWKDFIKRKKIEINIGLAAGSVNSSYGYGYPR